MLSDEEKEALEILNNTEWDGFMITIKNLIEKQQKELLEITQKYRELSFKYQARKDRTKQEIEELKNKNKKLQDKCKELIFEKQELTSALLDSTPNDKIKAKIEEVEQWELYNMKIPRLSTLDERLGAKIGIKYVLQSLLEKEGE